MHVPLSDHELLGWAFVILAVFSVKPLCSLIKKFLVSYVSSVETDFSTRKKKLSDLNHEHERLYARNQDLKSDIETMIVENQDSFSLRTEEAITDLDTRHSKRKTELRNSMQKKYDGVIVRIYEDYVTLLHHRVTDNLKDHNPSEESNDIILKKYLDRRQ